jgi:hypothetical protein
VIPRYQTVVFSVLLVVSIVMGVVLWQLRERAHQRLLAGEESTPTQAPEVAPAENATLLVANDSDGSLLAQVQSLPLPQDPGARARVVLGKLLDLYAAPDANHPVPGGAASIAQVFLLPVPDQNAASNSSTFAAGRPTLGNSKTGLGHPRPGEPDLATTEPREPSPQPPGSQLAVVNLTGAFAANHPSGLETETLTVLSICGTLRANLPSVTQVRFLVDGQQRATLAGHADLTRIYLTADAAPQQ